MFLILTLFLGLQVPATPGPADAELELIRTANVLRDRAEQFAALLESNAGSERPQAGLFLFIAKEEPPQVLGIVPDAPAARAGIRPRDNLVSVNGQLLAGLTEPQIRGLLEGDTAPRSVTLHRPGQFERSVTLTPRILPCLSRAVPTLDLDYPRRVADTTLAALDPILSAFARPGEPRKQLLELTRSNMRDINQLLGQTIDLFNGRLYIATVTACGVSYDDDP